MRGHVVGNLLIVGLWELLGDHVAGARLGRPAARRHGPGAADGADPAGHHRRGARPGPGRPRALTHGPRPGRGRHHRRRHRLGRARPAGPGGLPRGASRRSAAADWVVLGPGSWFTSVIPHLMVPELREALVADRRAARRGAQPRRAGGGDPRVRPGRPPRRARRARARPDDPHGARRPRHASATTSPARAGRGRVVRRRAGRRRRRRWTTASAAPRPGAARGGVRADHRARLTRSRRSDGRFEGD